jgi:hypothetical protein
MLLAVTFDAILESIRIDQQLLWCRRNTSKASRAVHSVSTQKVIMIVPLTLRSSRATAFVHYSQKGIPLGSFFGLSLQGILLGLS